LNLESKDDSTIYYVNDSKVGVTKGLTKLTFELKTKTGLPKPKSLGVLRRSKFSKPSRVELVPQPKLLNYKIVNIHPHDTLSFTEGLEFYKDTLYENRAKEFLF
jgi:hypothetical protein